MADQKVTIMMLKVDLQCCRCYKKIKKVLCKFPQIRDQVFDEKTNTIAIKVVCCSPEKIKQKIICKAGDTLQSIGIKEPVKPKPTGPENPESKPKKPQQPSKDPKQAPTSALPKSKPQPAFDTCCSECYQGNLGGPCYRGYGRLLPELVLAPPLPKRKPQPVFGACCSDCYEGNRGGPCYRGCGGPPPQLVPALPPPKPKPQLVPERNQLPGFGTCCSDCYHGNPGGPCYQGYGRPPPQCYQYDSYCRRSVYESYGGVTYYTNENPGDCSMM